MKPNFCNFMMSRVLRGGLMAVSVALISSWGIASSARAAHVWINEFHYDNAGGDVGEFVEIAGTSGTDLSGWKVSLYNGSNGTVYDTISLSGAIDDEGAGFGALAFLRAGIQNGSPDGLALVDPSDNVEQFLSYEGSFAASGGPANGLTSVDVGVSETSSTPEGFSLQLTGTGSQFADFAWSGPSAESPGSLNAGQTLRQPPNGGGGGNGNNGTPVPDGGASGLLLGLGLLGLPLVRRILGAAA